MSEWWLLGAAVLLIVVCGVFVAGEFALLAADRPTIERDAERGDRRAAGVLVAFRTLSTQLSGVQLAITITNLAVGFLAEPALATLLRGPLGVQSGEDNSAEALAVVIALVVSTLATMLFGELVPKNIAIAAPVAVAKVVQAPVRLFTTVMSLPIALCNKMAEKVLGLFGLRAQEELASARSPDELLSLVRHSASEGTLPVHTARLVVRSLTFGDRRVGEVMTPRTAMIAIDEQASVADFISEVARTRRSRLPVLSASDNDEVVGVLDIDRAITVAYSQRSQLPVRTVMAPPVRVPHSLRIDSMLRMFQEQDAQFAIVVDEYGGTAGLVTGEDVLEELVGEVDDEFDVTSVNAVRVGAGWQVAGMLRPDEISAATGIRLPDDGPYETLGGLLMQRLGRIPTVGDAVALRGVTVTVTAMAKRRVETALLVPHDDPGSDEPTQSDGSRNNRVQADGDGRHRTQVPS